MRVAAELPVLLSCGCIAFMAAVGVGGALVFRCWPPFLPLSLNQSKGTGSMTFFFLVLPAESCYITSAGSENNDEE